MLYHKPANSDVAYKSRSDADGQEYWGDHVLKEVYYALFDNEQMLVFLERQRMAQLNVNSVCECFLRRPVPLEVLFQIFSFSTHELAKFLYHEANSGRAFAAEFLARTHHRHFVATLMDDIDAAHWAERYNSHSDRVLFHWLYTQHLRLAHVLDWR